MASTSTEFTATPYPSSPRWDVFLSFYGRDTRRNFISHLYSALDLSGVLTYRDDPALSKGEEISLSLLDAIRNSKKFVVVISENYARSPWLLDELVEILKNFKRGKNRIIPIFYYVDPSDVRHQKGSFGDAFNHQRTRYPVDLISKWKSALTEISKMPGYHLNKDAYVSESDIVMDIVQRIILERNPKISWDVFLNFCGVDTRYKFTSHLYSALNRNRLCTYMDDPGLGTGEVISAQLLQKIRESKIYIVVFSENYASSLMCLDELVQILECCNTLGRLVVPIFYNIEKSAVHDQTGSFGEAFKKHETRFDMDRLAEWRATLTDIANLAGYPVCKNMFEADIINKVVDRVLLEINPKPLSVAKYPVGLWSRVRVITTLLNSGAEGITTIGIHGMGGVGKTTLAKAVYNKNHHRFQGSCFLENVREVSGTERGLVCLQQQLVNDVLKCKNVNIENVYQGIVLIKDKISSMKALIVIDDLESQVVLDYLTGPFTFGSTVIITTRNEDLLDSMKVEVRYKVNELGDDESHRLFSRHAFGGNQIPTTFIKLSQEILERAGGLPLALQVLGSNLLNHYEEGVISIDQSERLFTEGVEKKLQISFDALKLVDPMLQDIFLDIACFFIGWVKEEVVEILESCYTFVNDSIEILEKRCLLTINNRDELKMHGLIRDMGREIARNDYPDEPGKHSRLWASKNINDVLKEQKGTEAIEGIISSKFNNPDAYEGESYSTRAFQSMSKLRFLYLKKVNLIGSFEQTFEDLRWFFWDYCSLKCIPSEFYPKELVILELPHSKMTKMWELNNVESRVFENLKTLNMSYSLELTTTSDFTELPNLETLNLEGCKSLEEVHISIGTLKRLVSLNLCGCVKLKSIPDSIGNLNALASLNIGGCSSLETLPSKLGNIASRTELNARGRTVSDFTPTNYDVFISFCGKDTRSSFVSFLCSSLGPHGVKAFMDDPVQLRGAEVTLDALIQAIRRSKTYVVVFSENYASSWWCLDELVEILNCRKTIGRLLIPVFYNIDSSVVRSQTGSFNKAFRKHEIRFAGEMEKVKNWRSALKQVTNFSGQHVSESRSEADIIDLIVDKVISVAIPKTLSVAKYPVRLDSRVKDL